MTEGFLLVDKPGGITSHDVVGRVRRVFGIKKVGHAGTLDPMATGLLIVAVGRVTRLIRFVQAQPKTYRARMLMGVATDSLDADGAILSREPVECTESEIEAVLDRFRGTIMQIPPMVSALKVGGKRLHELAREGIEVEREPRPVTIHRLEILDFSPGPYPEVEFEVRCSTGTYVRTLGDDIARAVGSRAHLISLRRTAIGAHQVDDAVALDDLTTETPLMDPAKALTGMAAVEVSAEEAARVANGASFGSAGRGEDGQRVAVTSEGRLLGVYRIAGDVAVAEVVLS